MSPDILKKDQAESFSGNLDWSDFNVNFESTEEDPKSPLYKDLYEKNMNKVVDLRPYMIPRPVTVFENDCLQKCLDLFRIMHLR